MDEYLDILDDTGNPTGKSCLKSKAHKKGYFHPTVHVWFYTKLGKVLLQKRGANKQTFPNFWDVSVAGHVSAGESIETAALREVMEEIGLEIKSSQLIKIDVRRNINLFPNGIKDCEFQHVFLCGLKANLNELTKQDEEVDGLGLFTLEDFKFYAKNHNEEIKLVPADYTYYEFVIDTINKAI
jgi:isopentenyl-diphosphate delta-isomerase